MTEKIQIQLDSDSKLEIDTKITPIKRVALDSKASIETCITDMKSQMDILKNAKIESSDPDASEIVKAGIMRQIQLMGDFISSMESWKSRIYNTSQYMY
jgi:hypothetical protein